MKDINLLPDEIRSQPSMPNEYEKQSSSPKVVVFTILIVLVLGLVFFAPKFYIIARNKVLESLNSELSGPKYTEINNINNQLNERAGAINSKGGIINIIDNSTHPMNQILPIIKKSTPFGCSMSNIYYDKDKGTISIQGISKDKASAAEFLSNLKRISYISEQDVGLTDADGGFKFEYIFFFGGKDGK